nr:HesA/MoeB/ThiF family protein [Halioglobus japonicus]
MVYMPAMDERQRYQRHLQLQGFGEAGQQALGASHICIVGLGGLGCPASLYLAAAGVGRLTLVDGDTVSLSNLQRQVLFREADIDRNKAAAAAEQLAQRNSGIAIHAVDSFLDIALAEQLFSDVDLVLDCTDNFHTRYLINDICHALAKPWVYASVLGFSGQLALFTPGEACFRCLFPELSEAPDCNQAGVIGAVPGVMGTLQALEAIKFLGPENTPTDNSLVSVDGAGLKLRQFKLSPDPGCVLCSGRQTYRDRTADYQPRELIRALRKSLPRLSGNSLKSITRCLLTSALMRNTLRAIWVETTYRWQNSLRQQMICWRAANRYWCIANLAFAAALRWRCCANMD